MNPDTAATAPLDWEAQVEGALRASDVASAWRLAAQALAAAADTRARAHAAFLNARCGFVSGDLANGLAHALDAAAAYEALGDAAWHARSSALASRCLLASGDGGSALDHALVALSAARQAHRDAPAPALMVSLTALGNVYLSMGQLDTAGDYCQQALDCAIGLQDHVAQGAATDTLACVHSARAARARAQGRSQEAAQQERTAMRLSAEAVQIARAQGHRAYEATALHNQVESMRLVGEAPAALGLLDDWAQRTPVQLPRVRMHHLETRGRLCLTLGQAQQARALFEQALVRADTAETEISVVEYLAQACEDCGDHRAALAHHRRFHALHVQLAAAAAQRTAQVAAVRLDTERTRERAAALAHDNAKLQQHADVLQRQSSEDPLTGLANRRRLDELFQAGHQGCAVAMIDIDHFKSVNDRFSHALGDAVLCQLAALLRAGCRSVDTAVRLGGEEFVVLLPQVDATAAASAAERLRARIEAFDWERLAPGLAVTASIGVAQGSEAGSVPALLALADQRLYQAKRAGRNRVVSGGA